MLDEQKIKLMTKLAFYEKTQGKEDFKISEYYRKDYTSLHVICSILWVTVGYVCLGALVVLAGLDALMSKMSAGLIITMGLAAILGYFVLVIAYAVVTSHVYNRNHRQARQRVKKYNHNLTVCLRCMKRRRNRWTVYL